MPLAKDDEWKVVTSGPLDYTPEPGEGLGWVFFEKMKNGGEALAQINGDTGAKDTYKSLFQRCVRTAITMRSKGIASGDIIAICSSNHLDSCVPYIAALFVGAKVANLDPIISHEDTAFLLRKVPSKMVFVVPQSVLAIESALEKAGIDAEIVVFGKSEKHTQFSDFLQPSLEESGFQAAKVGDIKETALIFFSSGTTGLPKGICISHYTLLAQGYAFIKSSQSNISLNFASLYWISSSVVLAGTILSKRARLLLSSFKPSELWYTIEKYQVEMMFLAPSYAVAISKKGRPSDVDTSCLKEVIIGGGGLSKAQMQEVQDILPGTHVMLGYGLTEIGGAATIFRSSNPKDMLLAYRNPHSCGKVIDGMSIKVVDVETEDILGPNRQGEIRIKTDLQMNGYYKQDSSGAWDEDGWLKTGDVGYYDDHKCFYIVDRIKEMLKFQSWHVPPAQLEGILGCHPAVEAAVVVGIPHPEDGDHPAGVVVLKKSFVGKVNELELEQFVAARVSDRMRLRGGVRFIGSIPMTPTGKMKRRDIRSMIISGEI